jgi:flagellar M-ring protein FliF
VILEKVRTMALDAPEEIASLLQALLTEETSVASKSKNDRG